MILIDKEKCIGCGFCVKDCTFESMALQDGKAVFDPNMGCSKCGHCIAVCPKGAVSITDYDMNEVLEYREDTFSIPPETLLNYIKFRRTTRQFAKRDVEDEKIAQIIEAGRYTETGSNSQNVRYIVVREGKQTVKRMVLAALEKKGDDILAHPEAHPPLMHRYAKLWKRMNQEYLSGTEQKDKLLFGAPVLLFIVTEQAINGGLAAQSMELMTNALGLGNVFSGFIQRGAYKNQELKDFLRMSEAEEVVACMVLGYPQVKYYRTVPRKKPDITYR